MEVCRLHPRPPGALRGRLRLCLHALTHVLDGALRQSPQVELLENCGWDNFAPERLDFAGSISVGDVPRQVKDMLRLVNGTDADVGLVDIFFPQDGVSGHRNSIANDYRSFYAKDETIAAVKHMYQADYVLIPGIGRVFTEEASVVATTPSVPGP
eukprot:UN0944